jgi:hypothetical protein
MASKPVLGISFVAPSTACDAVFLSCCCFTYRGGAGAVPGTKLIMNLVYNI